MPKTHRRNPAREKLWRDTVAAWQELGQSVRAFCAARGVSVATFFARRRELTDQQASQRPTSPAPAPQFIPVKVVPDPTVEVFLPSGMMVRVPVTADPAAVTHLVAVLGGGPCCPSG